MFFTGALFSVFIWVSCMYVVGFAPLIILSIEFLHRCIVLSVHLGLVYVRCWFCSANLSCNCVFAPVHCSFMFTWDSCMYVVVFASLIILAIVFLHRCIVLCVHFGLVYVRCWFCTYNHYCNRVFAPVHYHLCLFGTRVCTLLVLHR
jgi:hypothetical protein